MDIIKKTDLTQIAVGSKIFNFPGGEVGLKLDTNLLGGKFTKGEYTTITHRIKNSSDFFAIAFAKDALERSDKYPTPIRLFLPYVPYARQDRVCVEGESLSIRVFADLLNSLKFQKVFILDPHSHVTEAVINNVSVFTQYDIIQAFSAFKKRIGEGSDDKGGVIFVSPDAGAEKKTAEIAYYFEYAGFVRSSKVRNLATGDILKITVDLEDFKGRDVVICDDICDGGRTFVKLAKILKSKNCGKVILYVTHGIFSKGLSALYANGIDEIYTTNSYQLEEYDTPPTAIFEINNLIRL